MKNLIKKTIATFILMTALTGSALAECPTPPPPCGNMQCPAPCLFEGSTTPDAKSDKDQESVDLSNIIKKMFEKIGFLF